MNRADWIRGMNNEELARFIQVYTHYYAVPCDYADKDGNCRYGNPKYCMSINCQDCMVGWLEEKISEEEIAQLKEVEVE